MKREPMSYNQVKMKIMDSKRPIVSSKNEYEKYNMNEKIYYLNSIS